MAVNPSGAFTEACAFVMPLGKYKGLTIARAGANEEGILYLDWLVGQAWVDGRLRSALETYLGHPSIVRQIESYLEDS